MVSPESHERRKTHDLSLRQMHIALHRPFFRRHSPNSTNISTDKCLYAAANIVRLVKLLKNSAGLRKAAPGIQHCAFNAGTILAISAVEDGISDTPELDVERRQNARKDLKFIVSSLKEIGVTWTTANTSAGVLEGTSEVADDIGLFERRADGGNCFGGSVN